MADDKCDPNVKKIDARILIWALGSVITIVLTLTGVVYSNLKATIDEKASKDTVEYMQKDLSEIKQDMNILLERTGK